MSKAETLAPTNIAGGSEILPTAEKLQPNFPFITINGRAGTGKSSLAELITKDFEMATYDVGGIFRRWDRAFGKKSTVVDYAERALIVDQRLDENTQRRMVNTNPKPENKPSMKSARPAVIVSRLGSWIAKNLENEGVAPRTPKVLLTTSRDIAAQRVWKREKKKNPKFDQTVEQVKAFLSRRNAKDFKALKSAHPTLTGNPMDPGLRDAKGRRVYDIVINTDNLSVEETKERLYQELEKKGFLRRTA